MAGHIALRRLPSERGTRRGPSNAGCGCCCCCCLHSLGGLVGAVQGLNQASRLARTAAAGASAKDGSPVPVLNVSRLYAMVSLLALELPGCCSLLTLSSSYGRDALDQILAFLAMGSLVYAVGLLPVWLLSTSLLVGLIIAFAPVGDKHIAFQQLRRITARMLYGSCIGLVAMLALGIVAGAW